MKKISILTAAIALAACSQHYYSGEVSYAQDNQDCIYEFSQRGDWSAKRFDEDKRITHKNALCSNVLANDMGTAARAQPRTIRPIEPISTSRTFYVEPRFETVTYNPVLANANRYYAGREVEIVIE